MMRAVACAVALAVPAQAFLHGGVAPLRAGALAARPLSSAPLQARAAPLALPRRYDEMCPTARARRARVRKGTPARLWAGS